MACCAWSSEKMKIMLGCAADGSAACKRANAAISAMRREGRGACGVSWRMALPGVRVSCRGRRDPTAAAGRNSVLFCDAAVSIAANLAVELAKCGPARGGNGLQTGRSRLKRLTATYTGRPDLGSWNAPFQRRSRCSFAALARNRFVFHRPVGSSARADFMSAAAVAARSGFSAARFLVFARIPPDVIQLDRLRRPFLTAFQSPQRTA